MAAEGMVHALELVHHLLEPEGILVDIHPTGDPPPAYAIVQGGQSTFAAWLHETDDLVEYAQAAAALAEAERRRLFARQVQERFHFTIQAGSYAELRQFLVENWSDIRFIPQDEQRIRQMEQRAGPGCQLHLTEEVLITRYQRL